MEVAFGGSGGGGGGAMVLQYLHWLKIPVHLWALSNKGKLDAVWLPASAGPASGGRAAS